MTDFIEEPNFKSNVNIIKPIDCFNQVEINILLETGHKKEFIELVKNPNATEAQILKMKKIAKNELKLEMLKYNQEYLPM